MKVLLIMIVVFGAVISVGVLFLVIVGFLRGMRRNKADDVTEKLSPEGILSFSPKENFFGQKSKGPGQTRGNGVWTLTQKRLYFELYASDHVIDIPFESVTGTRKEKNFLGRSAPRDWLLVLEFTNDSGLPDECAWAFSDLENQRKLIEQAAGIQRET